MQLQKNLEQRRLRIFTPQLLQQLDAIPASCERVVPTEWQVRTVLGDCLSRAKVIPAQAPQHRQYALISDFLDLANLSIQEEAALATNWIKDRPERLKLQNLTLATVTSPAAHNQPKYMTADVQYAINKCESLGSGKQLILHGNPSAIARGFSPRQSCVEAFHASDSADRAFDNCGNLLNLKKSRRHPTLVHSCANARLRSCIVARVVRLVRTLACLASLDTHVRPRPCALTFLHSCYRCVLRGQWALLDTDTYVLIDRSRHLVEPSWLSFRACAVQQQARRALSPRSRDCPSARSCREDLSELLRLNCFAPLL